MSPPQQVAFNREQAYALRDLCASAGGGLLDEGVVFTKQGDGSIVVGLPEHTYEITTAGTVL